MRASELPITETYEDVQRLIYRLVQKVHRKYGGDLDEMLAVANVGFLRAYKKFDPKIAEFNTLLGKVVFNHLVTHYRRERRHHSPSLNQVHMDESGSESQWIDQIPDKRPADFDLTEFAGSLSNDAQLVLALVLKTPQELSRWLSTQDDNVAVLRAAIKKYLRHSGWDMGRIKNSFAEIRGVL